MYKLVSFNADNGDREEQGALDLLMEFLNAGYDVGQFCEFGESVPELLITLPSAAFKRLSDAAKYSQYKSCIHGEHPESNLPYLIYDYSKAGIGAPCFKLIIQQGVESGAVAIRN